MYKKHDKRCAICKESFKTSYLNKNICSFDCRVIAQRERSRIAMRRLRNKIRANFPACEVCKYKKLTEPHHELDGIHYLCPTHHCLITRNYTTLKEMLSPSNVW